MKLGVYVPTHNNPVFARTALLQLEAQTVWPQVVVIHENGHKRSHWWSIAEIATRMERNGTKVINIHTPGVLKNPQFYRIPLKRLLDEGCDTFCKWDDDDIVYSTHLAEMIKKLNSYPFFDAVFCKNVAVTILYENREYLYNERVDWGKFNPTGACANGCVFTKRFAEDYVQRMCAALKDTPDDMIMKQLFVKYRVLIDDGRPTLCYVSHGRNISTSHWVKDSVIPTELRNDDE